MAITRTCGAGMIFTRIFGSWNGVW